MVNILTSSLFFLLVFLIWIIPFFLLYGFSDIFKLLLHNLIGYRRKVIASNLQKVFPNWSKEQHRRMVKLVYKNLADVFLEGVKAFAMTTRQVVLRHKLVNPEVLNQFYQSGRSVIGVTAHYGNWEWGSLSASLQTSFNTVAFYKRIDNPYIDRFVLRSRSKFGTTLASINETAETFEKYSSIPTAFLMAADQRTIRSKLDAAYWIDFLGIDTPFLHGPEKYARAYNLPVIYINVQRRRRGFYEIELSVLTENPSELPDGEITRRYAKKLEEVIRKQPENWLWSHRRWRLGR